MSIDIEKMNMCLLAGIFNEKAQAIVDHTFERIATFTNHHASVPNRGDVIALMIDDMYAIINGTPNKAMQRTSERR